jgi:peptidoglycan/xylan/chitin deacetylase (PgdA/CDA1 family)
MKSRSSRSPQEEMVVRRLAKGGFIMALKALSFPLYSVFRVKQFFWPDTRTTILVYHKISDLAEGLDAFWNVPPSLFARHMAYISQGGYTVLSLQAFYEHLRQRREPRPRSVVITFDDGYASVYRHAFPVLKRYGFPATIFLAAQYVGNGGRFWWDEPMARKRLDIGEEVRLLSWREIKEMQASGFITFGSHSMTHPHLGQLPKRAIEFELGQSKKVLEENLKQQVAFFAYPFGMKTYGDINDETAALLVEKGYSLACTSEMGRNGLNENLYLLKRMGIGREDSLDLFRAKLTGACDWLGTAQKTFQRLFKNIC